MMNISNFTRPLLGSTALVALSLGVALAQENTEQTQNSTTPSTSTDESAKSEYEIVVTGSRVKRSTFTSPVAMDVLTVEDAKIDGIADIGGLLQTATAASGSSQVTSSVSAAFVTNGGLGAETVGLRGLGANRTLNLINGRRAGPSGVRGAIDAFDLNSIPLAGVERVDILKDGASAVYGSDAIAGVINYITDTSDGGSIEGFTELTADGGAEVLRVSGSYGKTFDRGRFRVTGDYYQRAELARGDRDYLDCNEAYAFNADGSRADVTDPRTGNHQCRDLLWGHIWIYDYAGEDGNVPQTFPLLAQYDYDGSLAANLPGYAAGTPGGLETPAGWFPIFYDQDDIDDMAAYAGVTVGDLARGLVNYDHPFQNEETLSPKVNRITLMGDIEYEFTDSITGYAEALFNRRETYSNGYRQYWSYHYGENSFGTGTNSNPATAGWGGAQWFSPTAITDINDQEVTIEYMRFVAGLKGDFGTNSALEGWSWDVSAQYSNSYGEYVQDQINRTSLRDYDFTTDSCLNLDLGNGLGMTSDGRQCLDVPWFDPEFLRGNISDEVRDFIFFESKGKTDYTVVTYEGFMTGGLFDLPAGEMLAAVGLYHQKDEINDTPDSRVRNGSTWGTSSAGVTAGEQTSTAIYAEIEIPLVKSQPFFESLTTTLSARETQNKATHTDGRTDSDSGFNYRVIADWQIVPAVRIRGTMGTSFRSPRLYEQFLADETSFARQSNIDPCINWGSALDSGSISQLVADNCASDNIPDNYIGGATTATVSTGGGFGLLKPETSENKTLGLVWTPEFADLSVAFDYFEIDVKDEISFLSADQILGGCYSSENFVAEPLCALFDRNAPDVADPNRITEVRASYINVSQQINKGVDITVEYGKDIQWGRLDVKTQWTHQIESSGLLLSDDEVEDFNGELGEPKLTGFMTVNFDPANNWLFRYNLDYIGRTSNNDRFSRNNPNPGLYGNPVSYKNHTEATIYHAISTQYEFDNDWAIRGGVNNLFDEHPPAISASSAGNSPLVSNYDYLGRRFFLNIEKKF